MENIPCFYHPSTLVLINNNTDVMNRLSALLAPYYRSIVCDSPAAALQFIKKNHAPDPIPYLQLAYSATAEWQVKVAISQIHQQLFNEHRFNQAAIAFIHCDSFNGNSLPLAEKIKTTTSLQVVLTGTVDSQIAIEALHQKQIDYFLPENLTYDQSALLSILRRLHTAYFYQRSCGIWHNLMVQPNHPFKDPDFIAFFHNLVAELQATEYYLLDESGSFILVDANGELTWLVVRTEDDMQMFYEIAEGESAAPSMIEALRQRKKIVCLSRPHLYAAEIQAWKISRAKKLRHKKIYYCLMEGKNACQLDQRPIQHYADPLQDKGNVIIRDD